MKLYEIDNKIQGLIDETTGEILDFSAFEALQLQREYKLEQIALAYKNLVAEQKALEEEAKSFLLRAKEVEKQVEFLKGYLEFVLDRKELKTTRVQVKFRKSTALRIDCNVFDLPDHFLVYKTPQPDKMAIKQAIKEGQEIKGCSLEERLNISIK